MSKVWQIVVREFVGVSSDGVAEHPVKPGSAAA